MGEHCRLEGQICTFIISVLLWTSQGTFETTGISQLVNSFLKSTFQEVSVEIEDVLDVQVQDIILAC